MRKRNFLGVIVALVAVVFAMPRVSHAQDSARLRLIHAVANTTAVDFYIDGALAAGNVEFGGASPHITLPAGAHSVEVRLAGTPATESAVFSQDINLEATLAYSWVLQGDPATLAPVLYEDILDSLDLGFARVSIIHAAPAAPTVDIVRSDIDFPVVTGVSYGVPYGTLNFPVGAYDLVVSPTSGTAADAIAEIGDVDLRNGVYYTFVVAPNNDDPTQANAFVLETAVNPAAENVLTRFAHAAADGQAVDVYLNEVLVVTGLNLGELSQHVGLPSGEHELALREAGSAPNSDPIFTQTITIGSDPQTLAITAGDDGLTITALTDAAAGVTSDSARVQAVNLSSGSVDFGLDDTTEIAEGLEPLAVGEAVEVAPGDYPLGSGEKTLIGGTLYSVVFFDGAVVVEETALAIGLDSLPGGTAEVAAVAESTEEAVAEATEEVAEATEEVAADSTEAVEPIEATPAMDVATTPEVIIVTATPDPNLPTPTPIIIIVTATPETGGALPTPVAPVATQAPAVVATTAPIAGQAGIVTALCSTGDVVCGVTNLAPNANLLCREYPSTVALNLGGLTNGTEMIIRGVAGPRDETGEIGVTYAITVDGLPDFTDLAGPDVAVENLDPTLVETLQPSSFWIRIEYEPQPGVLFGCWVRADYVSIRYLNKVFDETVEFLDLIDSGAWEVVPYNVPGGPIEASPQGGAAPVTNNVVQPTAVATAAAPVSTTGQVEGRLLTSPGQTLNLRAEPNSAGVIRFAIPSETSGRATTVVVVGRTEAGDWLKVIFASPTGNLEGWVASDFVQLSLNGQAYDKNSLPVTP